MPQDRLKATMAQLASAGAARFLRGRSGAAASPPICRPPAARCRSKTSRRSAPICASRWRSPIAAAKCSRRPNSPPDRRWRIRCGLLQENLQARARRTGCGGLRRLRVGAAGGLSRTAEGHGRCRRPPRARRRSAGAGLHHAFLGGRPRRQHGGGDANPAVDVRLEIRHAADRHHHEQRHHVVRSDAGHAEFAGAGQALPDQLHAGAGAGRRRPARSRSAPPAAGASCRR